MTRTLRVAVVDRQVTACMCYQMRSKTQTVTGSWNLCIVSSAEAVGTAGSTGQTTRRPRQHHHACQRSSFGAHRRVAGPRAADIRRFLLDAGARGTRHSRFLGNFALGLHALRK